MPGLVNLNSKRPEGSRNVEEGRGSDCPTVEVFRLARGIEKGEVTPRKAMQKTAENEKFSAVSPGRSRG